MENHSITKKNLYFQQVTYVKAELIALFFKCLVYQDRKAAIVYGIDEPERNGHFGTICCSLYFINHQTMSITEKYSVIDSEYLWKKLNST